MGGSLFVQAFLTSLSVIAASEVGDKTFFIAAVMAMKNNRWVVFLGCAGALAVMTILSTALGAIAPGLIPKVYTHWATIILFCYFGLVSLKEAFFAKKESGPSELEEVEVELEGAPSGKGADRSSDTGGMYKRMLSTVFMKAFTMTFLAEWGDRSQIATISLAAEHDVIGVTLGGCIGHCICTGAAVLGGRQLAQVIDEKTVNLVGGLMFLFFGALTWYEGVEAHQPIPVA
eukprot:jgi/Ulvmu1/7175/UM034_0084.1